MNPHWSRGILSSPGGTGQLLDFMLQITSVSSKIAAKLRTDKTISEFTFLISVLSQDKKVWVAILLVCISVTVARHLSRRCFTPRRSLCWAARALSAHRTVRSQDLPLNKALPVQLSCWQAKLQLSVYWLTCPTEGNGLLRPRMYYVSKAYTFCQAT